MQANKKCKIILTIGLWGLVSVAVILTILYFHPLLSYVFDYFGPRQQKLSIVSNIAQIIAFFLEISFGVTNQKLINEKIIVISNESHGLDSPLSLTTPEKILAIYSGENWRTISYIDRHILDTSYLQHHPFIVIHGPMKSGKTREAAELIRFAIEDEIVLPSQIFDLTGALRRFTPDEIRVVLPRELRCEMRTLFFLNEIPADVTEKHLEALNIYLQALSKCSNPSYFIATMRTEHLDNNPLLQNWLEQNHITLVSLRSLKIQETNRLIDQLRETCAFPWNEKFRQEFVKNYSGIPYHMILTFQRLNRLGDQIKQEDIKRVASQSLNDIWAEIRRETEKKDSVAISLFQALDIFYQADVTPLTPLVFALAAWLERKQRFWKISRKLPERLENVARSLKDYGISYEDQFNFPDVAFDSNSLFISQTDACIILDDFLRNRSKQINPSIRLQALFELGSTYYYQNDQEKAISVFQEITRIFPQHADAWSNQGVLLQNQDRGKEAEEAYRKALAINSHHAPAWYNLGLLFQNQNRRKEAEEAYLKALAINPLHASIWYNLGNLLKNQEQLEKAEEAYLRALDANPQLAEAWGNLGLLLQNQYRVEEAEQAYRKALAVNPKYTDAWNGLGLIYRKQERFNEALDALKEAVRVIPENASFHGSLAAIYRKLENPIKAERELRLAQKLSSEENHYVRACIAALAGDESQAFSLLQEALAHQKITRDWVRQDPDWDELRQHSSYLELIGNEPNEKT